jgi:hypothetical protein
MAVRRTPITFLNVSFTSSINGLVQTFSTQASTLTTSNVLVNRGILRLSNTAGDPTAFGYGMTLCNTGIKVTSAQLGQISVVAPNPFAVAEATFDTTGVGGPLMAYGAGAAARGGYIFATAGDAMNFAPTGQVSICNAGVAQTTHSLYVGGNVAFNSSFTMSNGDLTIRNNRTQNADFYSTNMTIRNANFTMSNTASVTAVATFYSTQVTILNGGFIQSNTTGGLATALFYSTSMTVHGPISTTETLYCLGRFNSPNVGNISTLIVGNNIESTAKVSLDVKGSLRTGVQKFISTSGNINVNGGNLIYSSNASGTIILFIPETDGAEIGTFFNIHTDIGGGGAVIRLSTTGADYINTPGTRTYDISKTSALTSLFCYDTGSWHAVTTG